MRQITDTHFLSGGTHITNFQESDRQLYVSAVATYGDERLFVADEHTILKGRGGSLHWIGDGKTPDLGPFWDVFYERTKEPRP